jgi:glycosyltransferase involved in cell wall biosynthesis
MGVVAMTRPRVLHLQTDTGLTGGVANYISTLVSDQGLSAFDFNVVVPGALDAPDQARALYDKAEHVLLPGEYSAAGFLSYVAQLEAEVRRLKVDVLHAHAMRAAMAASWVAHRLGLPLVYTNHGLRYTQKTPGLQRAAFLQMERWICKRTHQLVCIRPFDAERARADRLIPEDRLNVVQTRIPAPVVQAHRAPPSQTLRLLGVGSLIDVKRPDRFLEWLAACQQRGLSCEATWVGDGPLLPQLKARSDALGLSITWAGQLDRQAVHQAYRAHDILLLTSQFEVMPFAVLEAFSHGLPVISGRFDGVTDFLEDNITSVLVNPEQPDDVARTLQALQSHPQRLEAMAQAAQQVFAARFHDTRVMAGAYADIYGRALRAGSSR